MPTAREVNAQTNARRQALSVPLACATTPYRFPVLDLIGAMPVVNRSLNVVVPQDAHLAVAALYVQGTALTGALTATLLSPAFPDGSLVITSPARYASQVVLGTDPAYLLPAGSTLTVILDAPSQVAAGLRAELHLALMTAPK